MNYEIEKINDKTIIKLKENLNYLTVSKISPAILNNLNEKEKVVFDLEEVKTITSAFFRLCLETIKMVGKDNFSIINLKQNEYLVQLFKISKFDKILNTDIED